VPTYYNEFNPEAAAMLRQLIADGHCARGDVDERSITEVKPDDLKTYTQCHFFAGIGGWSIALRAAGWGDDRPVWTGSAPCQPFSAAGRQKGKLDERHLLPYWLNLIRERRPATIFGEQVATAVAHGWLDDVYQGLEAEGYAVGAAVLPACSVGAPHRRNRLYFVANAVSNGKERLFANDNFSTTRQGWPSCPQDLQITPKWFEQQSNIGRKPVICRDDDGFYTAKPIIHALGNAIVPQVAAEFIKAAANDNQLKV
jgi:site-specific DNA-cytosine methylase